MGTLGLTLAVVGVYGVVSFVVSRRTHEIGIRMALGAKRGQILRLVLSQGMKLMIAGVTSGLILTLLVTLAIAKLLINTTPADPRGDQSAGRERDAPELPVARNAQGRGA